MAKFIYILAVVLFVLLAYAATRPARFRIERSALIAAPAQRIYSLLHDFRQWRTWSPWEGIDPDLLREYGGSEHGPGATYAWAGNRKVGQGRMEIMTSQEPQHLVIQLDFIKPFKASNTAEFTLQPEGNATRVTWAMHGPSPFMSRLMGLFFSMDKMVGADFERGLAALGRQAATQIQQ